MRIAEIFYKKDEYKRKDRDISTRGKDRDIISMEDKDNQRLAYLSDVIKKGLVPEIRDASYSLGNFAWGDLRKLGWAVKEQEPGSGSTSNERWTYTGPKPIKLLGNPPTIMKTGDSTDWIEVDYS